MFCAGNILDESGGDSRDDSVRFNIPVDDSPGRDNGIVSYAYARQYDHSRSKPYIFADDYGRGIIALTFIRHKAMVDGGKYYHVPYQGAISNSDTALILKTAAGVDEDIFPYGDILSKVGIERRKHCKRWVNGFSRQSGHQVPYLIRGMVRGVQFGRYPHGFLTAFKQKVMLFCSRFHAFPVVEMFNKITDIHLLLSFWPYRAREAEQLPGNAFLFQIAFEKVLHFIPGDHIHLVV